MSGEARQFRPETELRRTVDAFWFHATDVAERTRTAPTIVYPDGCIDLIFRARRVGGAVAEARLFVAGASETAYPVTLRSGESFVGVRFRPGMSRVFIDADPADLLGRDISAAVLEPRFASLESRLAEAASPGAALSILRQVVAQSAENGAARTAPSRALSAIALLGVLDAEVSVAGVARSVGASVRSLRRDVVDWTGLSPAKLSRIFRLQAALAMIRASPGRSLTTIAFEAGYADHPHMTREFRALASVLPSTVQAAAA